MSKHSTKIKHHELRDAGQQLFETNLTYSIMVLANLIGRNTSHHTLAKFPINMNEWRVLRMASIMGPVCAADVTATLAIDKSTVSRAVTGLHRSGLVDLAPNPQDRRQTFIVLTRKGWRLHGRIAPLDEAVDRSFESALTANEIASFHSIMRKLRSFAQQLVDRASAADLTVGRPQ